MANTPNLDLPEILTSQSQKEVTHNDSLWVLDAVVQSGVIDKDLTSPPGSPTNGDVYIVGASATGDWSGEDNNIAYYKDTWLFLTPKDGWRFHVKDENRDYVYSDSTSPESWVEASVLELAVYNNQTGTTYTIQSTDNGKILTFDNASSIAVTLPSTLGVGFQCSIIQIGAGVPTVTPDTGTSPMDTINGSTSGVSPSAQWKAIYLSQYSATNWLAVL